MGSSASTTCPSKIYMTHVNIIFFKDQCKWSKGDHGALGHPQRPRQAQLWQVQQVPVMFIKNWHRHMFIWYFSKTNRFRMVPAWYKVIKRLWDTLNDLEKLNQGEYSKYQLCSSKFDMTKTNRFKIVSSCYRGIKRLLDILINLVKFMITMYHARTVLNWFVFEKRI